MIDRWITDDTPSVRFPYYTRANADEVGPDPFSPLGWSLGWQQGCIPGVADGFISFGIIRRSELRDGVPEVFGNWGGYFYNQLSIPRMMGVRMPGATPEAIDQAYFGDHPGVPPYVPDPADEDEELSVVLGEKMAWVMTGDGHPGIETANAMSIAVKHARPDLSELTDAQLVQHARAMAARVHEAWVPYCEVCLGSSLGPGAVQAICGAIGRAEAAVPLLAAVGNVDSAGASLQMWDISRIVASSPELMAAFDAGIDHLLDKLRGSGSAPVQSFLGAFDVLIAEFGHRGPNEWDMMPHSWETKPEIALGMIERLRHQDDSRSPYLAAQRGAAERERLTAELTELTAGDPVAQGTLLAGLRSGGIWMANRERGKNAVIRLVHEGKVAFFELGRRMTERGVLGHQQQIFMLLESELDAFLADPASFSTILAERDATFVQLAGLEPPYIVKGAEGVPPISAWKRRGADANRTQAVVGEVLQGAAAAPGQVTGRARIVYDPGEAGDLEPDDILVVHTTDPSWTPLFLSVGGVICNVGAVASHAAIVCRELGVPCAVSVHDATYRIPPGALVSVDGSTGTVTVLEI